MIESIKMQNLRKEMAVQKAFETSYRKVRAVQSEEIAELKEKLVEAESVQATAVIVSSMEVVQALEKEIDSIKAQRLVSDDVKDAIKQKLIDEIALLKQLLSASVCPSLICVDGSIPVQVGPDCWEAEQCQFCFEKGEILK